MNVICKTCHSVFNSIYGQEQANNCASDVFINKEGKKEVISHYGSDFDTSRFILTDDTTLNLGIVCDKCLEAEIKKSKAIEDTSFNYFDQIMPVGAEIIDDFHVDLIEVDKINLTDK